MLTSTAFISASRPPSKREPGRQFPPLVIDGKQEAHRKGDVYSWLVVDLRLESTIAASELQGLCISPLPGFPRMDWATLFFKANTVSSSWT